MLEQGQKNAELTLRLDEALVSKNETDDNLKEIVGQTKKHEQDLSTLEKEVKSLTLSDAESRAECERLRAQESKTIESTELYKTQYEQLLEEYNQYLEDLENVQSKLKELESLKSTFENENIMLKDLADRYRLKSETLENKLVEMERTSAKFEQIQITNNEIEQTLSWQRQNTRELEERLKERDQTVDELQLMLEEAKCSTEIIEKQDSEMKEKDQLPNQGLIEQKLKEENEQLRQQIQMLKETATNDSANTSEEDTASNMMMEVLNEKTRENSQLKKENERLLQSLSENQNDLILLKESMENDKKEKEDMNKTAVHKLAQLIKDKDMEIGLLKDRNDSLLTVLVSQFPCLYL